MKAVARGFAGLLLPLLLAAPLHAAGAEDPIIDCMRANFPTSLRVQQVEFETSTRDGSSRVLRGTLYAMREQHDAPGLLRAMLRVEQPEAYAGAAYLLREDDAEPSNGMYVYLPAIRRVRRVGGSFADGALMGTDFSYREFRLMMGAFEGAGTEVEGEDEVEGRPVDVLVFTPPEDAGTRYSRVRVSIDRESCLPLRAEFYEGESLRKRYSADPAGLRRTDGHWYTALNRMEDLAERSSTDLRVLGVSIGAQMPERQFDPRLFHLTP